MKAVISGNEKIHPYITNDKLEMCLFWYNNLHNHGM